MEERAKDFGTFLKDYPPKPVDANDEATRVEQGKLSGAGTLGKKLSRGRSVSQTGSISWSSVSWAGGQKLFVVDDGGE